MIIDCIADLHGNYPDLEGGDLLIIAGDLTANDYMWQWMKFFGWFLEQNYEKRILIAGNHDVFLSSCITTENSKSLDLWSGENYDYLCDSGTEFEGLKIWGSPWTLTFPNINPHCTAFTGTEEKLEAKFALIPEDVDILVTHSPPISIMDRNEEGKLCGSRSLFMKTTSLTKLKLLIFGHIHESYGILDTRKCNNELKAFSPNPRCKSFPIIVNCSHVNENYQPVNKPVRIEL